MLNVISTLHNKRRGGMGLELARLASWNCYCAKYNLKRITEGACTVEDNKKLTFRLLHDRFIIN